MKRCPQCNRVETDEALKFCRVDGATLVNDSSSPGNEAGTGGLSSAPGGSEVHTSILPHKTDAGISRATGPTTTLPPPTSPPTGALAKPNSRKAIVIVVVVAALFGLVTAIVVSSYLSRKSGTTIDSIAVMPFVNESGNQDAEYLADGITETLIKSLSNLPNLNVKPRSSVFRYKGKDTDLKTIGRELNVQAILNGRVKQRGDELSLSLELVDVQKDSVIWTEQYQRKTSDLVSLQGEIARDISTKLKNKLSGAEETNVSKTATADPEAYQAYLKGRYYWNRRTAENIKKAIEQFKIATDRDPNYALAFVGLADCYVVSNEYAGVPTSETVPRARAYAERALSLDPQLAEPHATLAWANESLWQWGEAEKEFKKAIELNPNYPTAYHWYSIFLRNMGRYDESATIITRAHELDPLSSVISVNVSRVDQLQDNHAASIENSLKIIELDPDLCGTWRKGQGI